MEGHFQQGEQCIHTEMWNNVMWCENSKQFSRTGQQEWEEVGRGVNRGGGQESDLKTFNTMPRSLNFIPIRHF